MEQEDRSYSCWIPVLPPSINSAYSIIGRSGEVDVRLKKEARYYKGVIKQFIPPWKLEANQTISVSLYFSRDWYFKNGKYRKADVHNLTKVTVDAICEKLGVDDSLAFEMHQYKLQTKNEVLDGFGLKIDKCSIKVTEDLLDTFDVNPPVASANTTTFSRATSNR